LRTHSGYRASSDSHSLVSGDEGATDEVSEETPSAQAAVRGEEAIERGDRAASSVSPSGACAWCCDTASPSGCAGAVVVTTVRGAVGFI